MPERLLLSRPLICFQLDYLVDRLRFVNSMVVYCINPGFSSMFIPADSTARTLVDNFQYKSCRMGQGLGITFSTEFDPYDEIYYIRYPVSGYSLSHD